MFRIFVIHAKPTCLIPYIRRTFKEVCCCIIEELTFNTQLTQFLFSTIINPCSMTTWEYDSLKPSHFRWWLLECALYRDPWSFRSQLFLPWTFARLTCQRSNRVIYFSFRDILMLLLMFAQKFWNSCKTTLFNTLY